MNNQSRTTNSIRNAIISIAMQVLILILSFVCRTIFIQALGDQYLGISGLYTNILSMLSLADLGINTVMIYALYKPIANKDENEICRLVAYFKRLYRIIALVVLALGLVCVPFLQYIIKDSTLPLSTLRWYFILYLAGSVCSYLIVYKTTIINADQRIYLVKIVDFAASLTINILQIVVLYFTHNFSFYLFVNIGVILCKNALMSLITQRMYPFLNRRSKHDVNDELKIQLKNNIKSIFLYRVSAAVMNSTDNILISVILGTVVVGQYSNYVLIVTAINTFIMLIAQSVLSSLGNFNATEQDERKLLIFRCLLLCFYVVATFVACCFVSMFNDFIRLWVGRIDESYVLSDFTVYAITFNFYVGCILNPIWMYREAAGLFNQVKYSMTFAAILNIILSFVLGYWVGVGGIIVATALSKLLTNFWFEPQMLFKHIFHDKERKYWLFIAKQFILSLLCIIPMAIIGKNLPGEIPYIVLKIFISFAITLIVAVLPNLKTKEFLYIKNMCFKKSKKRSKQYE